MTRIWLLSDLHQEFLRDPAASRHPITRFEPADHAPTDFDVVVLAGDVDVPLTASLRWISERFAGVPTVYVPGNHDFFVGEGAPYTMDEQLDAGRELADRMGIDLLLDGVAVIDSTRFVGGTLWTDMTSVGHGNINAKMAEASGRFGMNDYRHIRRWSTKYPGKRKRIRPADTIAAHRATRAHLEAQLAVPHDGATVVVTHHAPHPLSLDAAHRDLTWCYASNLQLTLESDAAPDLWLHGHIHRAQDYQVGRTRIVSNPRGYRFLDVERDKGFDPGLVIDLGEPRPRPPEV